MDSLIKSGGLKLEFIIETNKPNSVLKISRLTSIIPNEIKVSHDLALLIGTTTTLSQDEYIKKLNSPSTYFFHCDLIDKSENFQNSKKSDLLATFDIKGKPYEKVTYYASPQQPLRDCSTDSHVNSITVGVRDQDGELFDFKGLPLEFQFEIKFYIYIKSSSNVLPSAPPEQLYPELPTQPQPDFRMQKVSEISSALNKEVVHYRAITKKYKRSKKVVNWSAAGSSVLSALFSSASFGSAISVVGLPATIPLGGVGGAFALASSGLIIASKKLDSKIKKHQEIVTLAIAKRDTVDRLLSKALADNQISDSEFQLIMKEISQYNVLKEAVRAKLTRQPSRLDVEKIKKEVRTEMRADFRKKMNALANVSN